MPLSRPNILFMLIDDLGARDLGCYGSTFYETPNLDRLATEGAMFTRAYASCPVCSPTRASVMTGKYPARVGITNYIGGANNGRLLHVPYLHYLPREEVSIARALKDGGYQTWHVGKWHLGGEGFGPTDHGFDVNIGGGHFGWPHKGHFSPWQLPNLQDGPDGAYLADRLTDEAIRLIRSRDRTRPFFLNLWHYAVHTPIQAPADLVEKYRAKAKALGLDRVEAIVDGEPMPYITPDARRVRRRVLQSDPVYAAMIENLDTNVGRVLRALDEEGLSDNTITIFTSDNGGLATAEGSPTCNLPLAEGKGWAEEGGNRVCQLMRWPGRIRPGLRPDTPVTSTDYYPTWLEAAGLPARPEQHVDGVSLLPLLSGGSIQREAIFWHFPHYSNQGGSPAAWVVSGDWKLIESFETGRVELYDVVNDPSETIDRASDLPDLRDRLHRMLVDWRADVEAKLPEPNPNYPTVAPGPNNAHE